MIATAETETAINDKKGIEKETDALKEITGLTNLADFDYIVISDGSGHHQDQTGGFCSVVIDSFRTRFPVMGSQTSTSVIRMEFWGLLAGLRLVSCLPDFYTGVRVLWICDNKSMTDGVNGLNKGTANEDLWLLFDYYASKMDITAFHIPRENNYLWHNLCDLHASTLREILLEYADTNVNFEDNEH